MEKIHAIIKGRVQGVGFRYFTEREARRRNISGWVRNNSDGSVETEACGTTEAIESFLKSLKQGPLFSRVDEINFTREECKENSVGGFEVRY